MWKISVMGNSDLFWQIFSFFDAQIWIKRDTKRDERRSKQTSNQAIKQLPNLYKDSVGNKFGIITNSNYLDGDFADYNRNSVIIIVGQSEKVIFKYCIIQGKYRSLL